MKTNKASGPNSIPTNILKLFKKEFSEPLSDIISLLSNISKISEKSMHVRPVNFLRKNKLLFCHKFGFWSGYSVNHAPTSLTELIRKALDEDKFAYGVFIDLQKAFDTVDDNILLSKLYH